MPRKHKEHTKSMIDEIKGEKELEHEPWGRRGAQILW
jgi:hypothetical protein